MIGKNVAKFCEKGLYWHNNNTGLIKQISLFDTALVVKNQFQFKIRINSWPFGRAKKRDGLSHPLKL